MSVKAILENYAQQKYFTHASYGEESFLSNETKIISYSAQQNALEYIYDIASLTKVFATGVMLVAGMEELQVKLATPVS